jgi:hypothetical protein
MYVYVVKGYFRKTGCWAGNGRTLARPTKGAADATTAAFWA